MFIGHFALGFAAKRVAPKTALGTFFAAGEPADTPSTSRREACAPGTVTGMAW